MHAQDLIEEGKYDQYCKELYSIDFNLWKLCLDISYRIEKDDELKKELLALVHRIASDISCKEWQSRCRRAFDLCRELKDSYCNELKRLDEIIDRAIESTLKEPKS